MIALSFKEVLDEVAYAIGLDPQSNLQENVAAALCRYIEKRVKIGWRFIDWPDLCPIEQRQFRPSWDGTAQYATGDQVYDLPTDSYYLALLPNIGVAVSDAATWTKETTFDRNIALDQPGCTLIGEPLEAYKRAPTLAHNPEPIPFFRTQNGMQFDPSSPNRPWVKFRLPTPRFSTVRADRNIPGQLGNVFFDPDDGNCYAVTSVAADWPPTMVGMTAEPQTIPAFLREFAESLREDGQHDKAIDQEAVADELLQDEASQLNIQQRQTRRYAMRVR